MRSWSTVSVVAGAFALPLAAPASANILVTIDKSAQQMSVAVDGAQRYVWPVSTGRPGYDTPNGTFKPNRLDADHFSQEWDNAPMPHSIFFDMDGHAIHGFFDVKHLGRAVSHGCVRLSPDHATTLFNLIKEQGMGETKVVVAGRTPGGDNAPVARAHLPANETVSNESGYGRAPSSYYGGSGYAQPEYAQPTYAPPTYAPPGNAQPGYAQPGYAQPGYAYVRPYQGQSYAPNYPPQPPPVYGPQGYWGR